MKFSLLVFSILLFSSFGYSQGKVPPVTEIVRINPTSAFFLTDKGRIGVARFENNLKLNAWDYYSDFQWLEARHLAVGLNLSIVSGTSTELTQAFNTNDDGVLDFYQDTLTDWPGRGIGAKISCGPIADSNGRLLFAVTPPPTPNAKEALPSIVYSLNPNGKKLTRLVSSDLPIGEMAISEGGILAAWIKHPGYKEGYYLGITQLPAFDITKPDVELEELPTLSPNVIIPTELTNSQPIRQLCFFEEDGLSKILVTIPEAKRLIEVVPELHNAGWGGLVTVRRQFDVPVYSAETMDHGKVIVGAEDGFHNLNSDRSFHYTGINIAKDAIEVKFSHPINRAQIVSNRNSIRLSMVSLGEEIEPFEAPEPIVESDGMTVVLPTTLKLPKKVIIKVETPLLTSEEGVPIASSMMFYTQRFE